MTIKTVAPLYGPELRALRKLQPATPELPYVFLSERGSPLSTRTIRHILLHAGLDAQLPFPVTTWKVSCNLLNLRKQFTEGFFSAVFVSP